MKIYSKNKNYKLYEGSMLDMLEVIEPNTIDSIICDPPYELNFMNKGWDNTGIAFQADTWKKCYEVLKPGGYLLAFGGSRTFHRIACAIEDAGFEIRDTIMWLYGSGFPKSMDISKQIDKKEGAEREVIGTHKMLSGWNLDENKFVDRDITIPSTDLAKQWQGWGTALKPSFEPIIVARKPFKGALVDNIIEYGVGGINIDECRVETNDNINPTISGGSVGLGRFPANTILTYDEAPSDERLRYFYCAKASTKDRNEGIENFKNIHPTVKPTELMQYLIRLVSPEGATILDPFNGSGSTGKAVMYENKERNKKYKYIGIELTPEYLPIAKARIEYVDKINRGEK